MNRAVRLAARLSLGLALLGCRSEAPDRAPVPHPWQPDRSAEFSSSPKQPPAVAEPATLSADGALHARLDNGLSVSIRERHEVPLVASVLLYKVGARDEPAGQTGLSHFLEHMMFKGTERLAKGQIDLLTMRNGGQNNAFTTKDVTAYHFLFPSDRWQVALDIEADRMRNCRFDPAEVDAERNVVKEEMRGDLDGPWEALTYRLDEALFGERGYAHPILGYEKDLDAATRDRFFEHYRRWYAPNNAVLALEGDLDAREALRAVQEKLGQIAAVELTQRPTEPAAPGGAGRVEVENDASIRRCMIGVRTCRYAHPDTYALHVIAAILAQGKSSRLKADLARKRQLLRDVSVWQDDAVADSALYVQAELYPRGDTKQVEEALLAAFARLRDERVSDAEMERARNQVETEHVLGAESALDHASTVAMTEALTGGPGAEELYVQAIRAVTAEDVQRAARRYLVPENAVVGWTVPKKKGSMRGGDRGHRCAREAGTGRPALALPKVERWKLDNGLVVLFQRATAVPAVTIEARVLADRRTEPVEKAGLVHLVGASLASGTATRSEDDVLAAIESVGGRLEAEDEDVEVQVLSRHFDRGVEVVADLLRNASFPSEGVERARKETLGEIAFAKEDPDTMARDAFREVVYGTHPYARPRRGYAETVRGISREDVVAHHRAWYRPNNAILVVVGDAEASGVRASVERHFGAWERADLPTWTCPPAETEVEGASNEAESQQATVYLGHEGVRRLDPDYDALLVMEHVLGTGAGFTDRVSKKVRDELGLCYSCWAGATHWAGEEPGAVAAYVACKPENEAKAVEAMKAEIARFIADGPTEEELRDAKDYLVASRAFDFETGRETADYWIEAEQVGLPADEIETFPARIEAVTRDEVIRVARERIHLDRMAMARVGPPPKAEGGAVPATLKVGAMGVDAAGRTWTLAAWEPGKRLAVRQSGRCGVARVSASEGSVSTIEPPGVTLPVPGGLVRVETRDAAAGKATTYSTRLAPARVLEAWLVALGLRGW